MGTHPVDELDALTPAQRQWARHSEQLWQRAHALASDAPAVDPGDVYHALRCLELAPAERLKQGLSRVRRAAGARYHAASLPALEATLRARRGSGKEN